MGTRSTTQVRHNAEPLLTFYRHFDGYPSGHGLDMLPMLERTNLKEAATSPYIQCNGAGNFAAMLLASIVPKDRKGTILSHNIYLVPHQEHGEHEYTYTIDFCDDELEPLIKVQGHGLDLVGLTVEEFSQLCNSTE